MLNQAIDAIISNQIIKGSEKQRLLRESKADILITEPATIDEAVLNLVPSSMELKWKVAKKCQYFPENEEEATALTSPRARTGRLWLMDG